MRFPNEQSLPEAASAAVWPVSGGTEGGEATAPHCGSPEPARSTSGRWWPATPAHSPQLHGQTHKGQGDAASGTTLHTSHFAPVLSSQGRVSQVRPRPAGPPRSRITWAAQATVRPALPVPPWPCPSLGPPQRRPPPGPGPVPSLLGRAQPCPPLAQSLREDGGPVTGWCRRGSEHGARREAAPPGARRPRKTRGDGRGGRRQEEAARPGRAGDSKEEGARARQRRQLILPLSGPKMSQPRDSRSPTLLPVRMRTHRSHFRGPAEVPPPRGPAPYPGALTHPARRLEFGARESGASWRRCVVIG
nr:translation initiation factor IF-2-like [Peromyscus maniculatus bairdii]